MNPDHQHRLDEIIEGQRQVHQLVRSLDLRVEALRRDLQAAKTPVSVQAPVAPPPAPRVTVEPPPLPRPTAPAIATQTAPPPLPALSAAAPLPSASAKSTHPLVPPRPEPSAKDAGPSDEPFELRFGTFWLVRIGIVIFLTGLVFLGNFAYQHFVVQLGAPGKLALLYLAGGTLLGAGLWLDRKRESMRNYARVLTAGGAAAVYYTTYAAHYVAQLRVIESAFVGGLLLLALAGGIVWIAERKRSETLALLAVLLAYYTSSINAIGLFTLFSAVLLALVSLFFLLRHGWTRLSIASLVGTYASYGFWRFHSAATDGLAGATEFGSAFLATYWVIFTAAIFLRSASGLSQAQRMPFFTANNAAFFALGTQHIVARWPSSFWLFALAFGVVLLALAWHAARRFPEERALDGAALAQGIALITVGLAAKLNGFQLGLTLAAESVVLLTCSRWRHPAIYKLGAALAALGATLLTVNELAHPAKGAATLGACVAALLLFDAWWIKRLAGRLAERRFELPSAGFAVCGLFVAGLTIWDRAPAQWQPAIMAGVALACALSLPLVRLPEIALPGQLFLGIALMALLPDNSIVANALVLCAAGLALEQWWRRQRFLAQSSQTVFLESASAIVAIFAGWWWLLHQYRNDDLMIAAAIAGAGMFIYAIALRARATLLAGQFYTGAAIVAFAGATTFRHPNAIAALVPILAVIVIAWLARRVGPIRFSEFDRLIPFAKIALVYAVAAMLLGAGWVFEFVPAAWHVVVFAAASALFLLLGRFTHVRVRIVVGALIGLFAMALFCARIDIHPTFAQLIAIVAIPAAARLTIRTAPDEQALSRDERNILAACGLGCIWLWVTRWTQLHFQPVHLTFAWSLLALAVFAAGFAVRERIYRLGGLAILALAIGRVFFVDLWQFETIYRILGFLVLGAVLLLLGFTYNRFSEQLRRWL